MRMAHTVGDNEAHFDSNWPVDNIPKSPYSLFQLNEKSFTTSLLKKRFHELARLYHPDHSSNKTILKRDQGTELTSSTIHENVLTSTDKLTRFKIIKEAYELLRDPKRKRQFDMLGSGWMYGPPLSTSTMPRYETRVQYYNAGTWEDYSNMNKEKEEVSPFSMFIWFFGLFGIIQFTTFLSQVEESVNKRNYTHDETERDLTLAHINYGLDDDKWSRLRRFLWYRAFGLYNSKDDLDREAKRNEDMINNLMKK